MISIIIVNYKAKDRLLTCLSSITTSKTQVKYEIIIVDNDENKLVQKEVTKFSHVTYLANKNKGFGEGNNRGASTAKGEYLFFLNPDTELLPGAIDRLYEFIKTKKHVGTVAPKLLGKDKKPYHQGERILTPFRGMVALSFVNKLFPNNPISRYYWDSDANYDEVRTIDVTPGTAFIIRKDVFEKIGGFDEKFFLYFEEFDLCKRLHENGYKNYIIPNAQILHFGAQSTQQRNDIDEIFSDSKFYYFRKHFGLFPAFLVQLITSFGKAEAATLVIASIGFLITVYNLSDRGTFIGDQGWFYLSARDLILGKEFPLVGIASSRPWLHQGALWTYMLAIALYVGKFNPFAGFILSSMIGFITTIAIYILGKQLFGKNVGLVACSIYSSSFVIFRFNQMPYHTTPIPLFVIGYIFSLYKITKGKMYFIPIALIILSILYQLELFSVILFPLFLFTLWYAYRQGILNRTLLSIKNILISLSLMILSFLPIIIYDITHGFPQTFGFVAWMGYSVLKAVGLISFVGESHSLGSIGLLLFEELRQLIFYPSGSIALALFFLSCFIFFRKILIDKNITNILIALWLLLPLLGILITKTASDAYFPVLFPVIVLIVAYAIYDLFRWKKVYLAITVVLVIANIVSFIYLLPENIVAKYSLQRRIEVAKQIVHEANGRPFNVIGKGEGSQFRSFTMNHEYLLWWLGGNVVTESVDLQFVITENEDGIFITTPSQYARMLQ